MQYMALLQGQSLLERVTKQRQCCEYDAITGPWYKDSYITTRCKSAKDLCIHYDSGIRLLCERHHFCAHLSLLMCDDCALEPMYEIDSIENITEEWWAECRGVEDESRISLADSVIQRHDCGYWHAVEKDD